ncbi:MAG: hypothetical protein Q8Q12_19245, partial [bacterium]|nr:hypothetical protein [bacterium]
AGCPRDSRQDAGGTRGSSHETLPGLVRRPGAGPLGYSHTRCDPKISFFGEWVVQFLVFASWIFSNSAPQVNNEKLLRRRRCPGNRSAE